jgi:hypothetical protein
MVPAEPIARSRQLLAESLVLRAHTLELAIEHRLLLVEHRLLLTWECSSLSVAVMRALRGCGSTMLLSEIWPDSLLGLCHLDPCAGLSRDHWGWWAGPVTGVARSAR